MKGFLKCVFLILILCSLVLSVSAAKTRLNITMEEVVSQNVSYGMEFYSYENQTSCTIVGTLNITNPGDETISDIYLNFTNCDNLFTNFTWKTGVGGRNGAQIMGSAPTALSTDVFRIHIPELRPSNYTTFTYNLSCTNTQPPLDLNTTYSNFDHGFGRKVLAGEQWWIHQSAINVFNIPLTNVNITIDAVGVPWNVTVFNFTLNYVNRSGDWSSVHNNSDSNETWWWEPNLGSGIIAAGSAYNITYVVRAPDNVPYTNTYMAIRETLEYSINNLASNLSLDEVRAIGGLIFKEDKRIVKPAHDEFDTNVTWEVTVNVSTDKNITYTLEKVSLWITETLNVTDKNTTFGFLNLTYAPSAEVNLSTDWSTPADDSVWRFNFSDGSDGTSSPAPIVWIKPAFRITNNYQQILNSTLTRNGNDLYMKYIYVINGYWLQIDKNITSVDADTYQINVWVENIGNAWTPQGLDVTVYDFIPSEFTPFGWTHSWQSNQTVFSSEFNGTAFQWVIPKQAPYNASLGPMNGPAAVGLNQRSWNLTYYVNGSGAYKVSELYIVGLDPRKVDGAGTHEGITVLSVLSSQSMEVFYIVLVGLLVVLNIVNFMMTKRINKRLEEKIIK